MMESVGLRLRIGVRRPRRLDPAVPSRAAAAVGAEIAMRARPAERMGSAILTSVSDLAPAVSVFQILRRNEVRYLHRPIK